MMFYFDVDISDFIYLKETYDFNYAVEKSYTETCLENHAF